MLSDDQVRPGIKTIIEEAKALYKKSVSITSRNSIPDTSDIPLENQTHWLKIPDVICAFVDMKGSTQLSATTKDSSTAACYQLYTGTAVKIFNHFEAAYIDVRGDGVFALFDGTQPHRALAASVTFKTFAELEFSDLAKDKTGYVIGSHCGIDVKTLLVRKIGLKRYNGRTDRQNEVWAGKTVNMAAKLASLSDGESILASERFHSLLSSEFALMSCGCPDGHKTDLWKAVSVKDDVRFDFDTAFRLGSRWCKTHGRTFCESLLQADKG